MAKRAKKVAAVTLKLSQADVGRLVGAVEFMTAALLEQQMVAIMAALGYRRSDNTREGVKVQ